MTMPHKILFIILLLSNLTFPLSFKFDWAFNTKIPDIHVAEPRYYFREELRFPLWRKSPLKIALGAEYWNFGGGFLYGIFLGVPLEFKISECFLMVAEQSLTFEYKNGLDFLKAQIAGGADFRGPEICIISPNYKFRFSFFGRLTINLLKRKTRHSEYLENHVNSWVGISTEFFITRKKNEKFLFPHLFPYNEKEKTH